MDGKLSSPHQDTRYFLDCGSKMCIDKESPANKASLERGRRCQKDLRSDLLKRLMHKNVVIGMVLGRSYRAVVAVPL